MSRRMASTRNALFLLAILTFGRTCVSFQFQSVTPLTGYLREFLSFNAAGFGLLISLYTAPGALVSVISPILARRYGSARTLSAAFLCMAGGQLLLIVSPVIGIAYVARVLAGLGGCVVYVLTIDVAAQRCEAGRMPARMALIAASWPFGNALSLVALGVMVDWHWARAAAWASAVFALVALVAIKVMLKKPNAPPDGVDDARAGGGSVRCSAPWRISSLVGSDWWEGVKHAGVPGMAFALYNVSFILFVSFTPTMLAARGMTPLEAANIASLPMWVFVFSVPLGGYLAGHWADGRKTLVVAGCLGGAVCMVVSQFLPHPALWYVAAGLFGGLPTGPMMASDDGAARGLFYPVFFFLSFFTLLVFPPIVGWMMEATGEVRMPIIFGVVMLMSGVLCFSRVH